MSGRVDLASEWEVYLVSPNGLIARQTLFMKPFWC